MIRLIAAVLLALAALPADAADKAWKVYEQEVEGGTWEYHVGLSGNDRCFTIMSVANVCNAGLAGDFYAAKVTSPATGETHVYLCERLHDLTEAQWQALEPQDCWQRF